MLKLVKDLQQVSFDDFWSIYPKKVAKRDALKAWARVDPTEFPKILNAVSVGVKYIYCPIDTARDLCNTILTLRTAASATGR